MHFQVEMIPLLHARRQEAADHHHRGRGRGQELIGVLHADRLQLVEQGRALRRRRRIIARAIQAGDQGHRFDLHREVSERPGHVADQSGGRFDHVGEVFRALRAKRGRGATGQ